MQKLLALAALSLALPLPALAVDYETQIKPIFQAKCTKCHGEKKELGGFAMHAEALEDLISQEYYIIQKDATESEVYKRLILPADDKLMMPKGAKPLPKEQIELVKAWIDEGAPLGKSPGAPSHGGESKTDEPALPSPEPVSSEVLKGIADTGASVVPLFAGSSLMSISYPSNPKEVNDQTLDKIAAAGPNVVWLSLAGSEVTDEGAKKLAACENLMRLHLENTKVTDAGVAALAGLGGLEYLNLYGTKVTDASIQSFSKMPRLSRLYVWQTDISFEAAKKLMAEREGLEVNLGWDHPGVVRDRLTKEITRLGERKAEAAKQAKQAEAALEEAKKQVAATTSREAELKKELEALDKPAEEKKEEGKKPEEPKAEDNKA